MKYSIVPEENQLIEELMASYKGNLPRSFAIERDWDEDLQCGSRPYSRVRSVDIYDGAAWVEAGMPKDFTRFQCGTRMEAW